MGSKTVDVSYGARLGIINKTVSYNLVCQFDFSKFSNLAHIWSDKLQLT